MSRSDPRVPASLLSPLVWSSLCWGSRWVQAAHHDLMEAEILDALYVGYDLLFEAPPRHSKSETFSRALPGWFMGRYPDKAVMHASYAVRLGARFGGRIRNDLSVHGPACFGVTISKETRSKSVFELADAASGRPRDGRFFACGVEGGVHGEGADLLVTDDLVKGAEAVRSDVQLDAYVTMCRTLCHRLDLDPATDIMSHFEWAPGRKIDPAGPPSPFAGDNQWQMWDMDKFRAAVTARPTPPPPVEEETVLTTYSPKPRLVNTRTGKGGRLGQLGPGEELIVGVPAGRDEQPATAAIVTVTTADATERGYIQVDGIRFGEASDGNYQPGDIEATPALVSIDPDIGGFRLRNTHGTVHVLVDLAGIVTGSIVVDGDTITTTEAP